MPGSVFESELWLRRFPARLSRVRRESYISMVYNSSTHVCACAVRMAGAAFAYDEAMMERGAWTSGSLFDFASPRRFALFRYIKD